jgi:glucose-1-phosphate thymidylyltransferase
MQFGMDNIGIVSTPAAIGMFKKLLGDGSQFGIRITYIVQREPGGIAEAFLVAGDFLGNDGVCLILGGNVFYIDFFS